MLPTQVGWHWIQLTSTWAGTILLRISIMESFATISWTSLSRRQGESFKKHQKRLRSPLDHCTLTTPTTVQYQQWLLMKDLTSLSQSEHMRMVGIMYVESSSSSLVGTYNNIQSVHISFCCSPIWSSYKLPSESRYFKVTCSVMGPSSSTSPKWHCSDVHCYHSKQHCPTSQHFNHS